MASLSRWSTARTDLDQAHAAALQELQVFFHEVQSHVMRFALRELHARMKAATTAEERLRLLEDFAAAKAGGR
jgi:hypothetical protein